VWRCFFFFFCCVFSYLPHYTRFTVIFCHAFANHLTMMRSLLPPSLSRGASMLMKAFRFIRQLQTSVTLSLSPLSLTLSHYSSLLSFSLSLSLSFSLFFYLSILRSIFLSIFLSIFSLSLSLFLPSSFLPTFPCSHIYWEQTCKYGLAFSFIGSNCRPAMLATV
jgi:hypothetical protein